MKIGTTSFRKGQPVLYIDSAKTSTLEGASTTVYAQGGKGNTRLIAWEGEKTLTFTVEDALLSPVGFAILSGAGIIKNTGEAGTKTDNGVHVHMTAYAGLDVGTPGTIDLSTSLATGEKIDSTAPVFVTEVEADGSIIGMYDDVFTVDTDGKKLTGVKAVTEAKKVFVDFYVVKKADDAEVTELQIDASAFSGNFYVEASTLFRKEETGKDMPAEITLPNVKIQSNFTFSMASSGDPSTFTFTMDALPGYTFFDQTKKVMCVIQTIDASEDESTAYSVMGHATDEDLFIKTEKGEGGATTTTVTDSVKKNS